jgi:hypothetical protein
VLDTHLPVSSNNLGKRRKVLTEPCPQCGGLLELRSVLIPNMEKGEEYTLRKDKIVCPKCLYERRPNKENKNQWKNHRRSKGDKSQLESDME